MFDGHHVGLVDGDRRAVCGLSGSAEGVAIQVSTLAFQDIYATFCSFRKISGEFTWKKRASGTIFMYEKVKGSIARNG